MSNLWFKFAFVSFVALAISLVIPPLPFGLRWRRSKSSPQVLYPDVTAIVLNWSRLPNVVKIASVLCSPRLDGVVANVTIWNNSPQPITHTDFEASGCLPGKLHIYNSPRNVYFQARFLACSQAPTPYCFIQDDDYLVWPEILRTLRARIPHSEDRGLHLLPPSEVLSSTLRNIHVNGQIHTGFAWLGHGAMVSRSRVRAFLQLMKLLKATEEEMKMADNYYTILGNTYPEIWFDQGVELGGGEAFTVGADGNERNRRHIMRAIEMLDSAVQADPNAPYIRHIADEISRPSVSRAPCRNRACLFESNIQLLASDITHSASSVISMLYLEAENLQAIDPDTQAHYLTYPPSHAVDGYSDTAFCAMHGVHRGDYWLIDFLEEHIPIGDAQLVVRVDALATAALRSSILESSLDGIHWTHIPAPGGKKCDEERRFISANETWTSLTECRIPLSYLVAGKFRFLRMNVLAAVSGPLCFYGIWVEGV